MRFISTHRVLLLAALATLAHFERRFLVPRRHCKNVSNVLLVVMTAVSTTHLLSYHLDVVLVLRTQRVVMYLKE